MDKLVYDAMKMRQRKSKISNEIKVTEFFRDIFTDEYSLIGKRGRVIKCLREAHQLKSKKPYSKRTKYCIK